jgi:Ni/Fe-hydrogenase subunit HybB-like protein
MAGSPWGLYIAFDVYFVGISFAGITVAALVRLLNLEKLKPISRMAELLTVISLLLAAFTIIPADCSFFIVCGQQDIRILLRSERDVNYPVSG